MSKDIYHDVRSIPLQDVMSWFGIFPVMPESSKDHLKYVCPFEGHADTDPSLDISTHTGGSNGYQTYHCFGCNRGGEGAIDLAFELAHLHSDPKMRECTDSHNKEHFRHVVAWLCANAGIETSDYLNHDLFFRRAEQVTANEEGHTLMKLTELGEEHVKWLGLDKVTNLYGEPLKVTPEMLARDFGLVGVESFVTKAKTGDDGKPYSWKVRATKTYPIMAVPYDYRYINMETGEVEVGTAWRKYEPKAKDRSIRFKIVHDRDMSTWKANGLVDPVMGDMHIMKALRDGNLRYDNDNENDDENENEYKNDNCIVGKRVVSIGEGKKKRTVFRNIVICSGMRDAINLFYRFPCHVVWAQSESATITKATIARLLDMVSKDGNRDGYHYNLYVLYDNDQTGSERSRVLALANPEVGEIKLPDDLHLTFCNRTNKPCKDYSEYVEYYHPKWQDDGMPHNMTEHTRRLVASANHARFWLEWDIKDRTDYKLDPNGIGKFLDLNGYRQYRDRSGLTSFVTIQSSHIMSPVPTDDKGSQTKVMVTDAKRMIREWLNIHVVKGNDQIKNAVLTGMALNESTVQAVPFIDANFRGWNQCTNYLLYKNTAVRVGADDRECVDYSSLPYTVMSESVMPYEYHEWKGEPLVTIVRNPDYDSRYAAYLKAKDEVIRRKGLTTNERIAEERKLAREWMEWKNLNEWRPEFQRPVRELPHYLRFIYGLGDIFWEQTSVGTELTDEQQKIVNAHFCNKFSVIGYLLCRWKDPANNRFVYVTDNSAQGGEDVNNGRGGKSLWIKSLGYIMKMCQIGGKHLSKQGENIPTNFTAYRPLVDGLINIDELPDNFDMSVMFNLTSSITVRYLYKNTIQIPFDECAKIVFTSNKALKMNDPSLNGRITRCYVSNRYHEKDMQRGLEGYNFKDEFGYILDPAEMPTEEWDAMVEFCIEAMQFYMKHGVVIDPPMTGEAMKRGVVATVQNRILTDFLEYYLAQPDVWERFIPKREVCADYILYHNARVRKDMRKELTIKECQMMCITSQGRVDTFADSLAYYLDQVEGADICPDEYINTEQEKQRGYPMRDVETYPVNDGQIITSRKVKGERVACWFFHRRNGNMRYDNVNDNDDENENENDKLRHENETPSATKRCATNTKAKKQVLRHVYGKHRNVRLSDEEYTTICGLVGEEGANAWIEYYSEERTIKTYKYKSDHLALKRWIRNAGGAKFPPKWNNHTSMEGNVVSEAMRQEPQGMSQVEMDDIKRAEAAKRDADEMIECLKRIADGDEDAAVEYEKKYKKRVGCEEAKAMLKRYGMA